MTCGEIIKTLRKKLSLTQDELATLLKVNKSSIQKYESNEVPNLKVDTIRKLSKKFGVSANAFIFPERYKNINLEIAIKVQKEMRKHHDILLCELNEEGRRKVFEYAKDLRDSGNYKDKIQNEEKA